MHVWKWWSGSEEERKKEKERRKKNKKKKQNVGVGLKKERKKKKEEEEKKTLEWVWRRKKNKEEDEEKKKPWSGSEEEKKKERKGKKKKKKERKKEKMSLVRSGFDLTTHKSWAPQSQLIYELATEWSVLSFKNSIIEFSLSITHTHFFESLSHENGDPKLIQTSALPWDPHDLDDENRKLSDITQNSLHPNKLLLVLYQEYIHTHTWWPRFP